MQQVFAFMRKHGFRTAHWDGQLICFKAQFFKHNREFAYSPDLMHDKIAYEWEDLNEELVDSLGEAERWFHV